jgi:hypothetical protein
VSFASIGVLGGTVFFAGLVTAKLSAARFTSRVGADGAARLACTTALAGNVLLAVSPIYWGLPRGGSWPASGWGWRSSSARCSRVKSAG